MYQENSAYQEDIDLIMDYLRGESQAEKVLYTMLKKMITGLIRQLSKRGSVFRDKDNVISQIMYEVLVKDDKKLLRNYQAKSKLSTYLFPIVRNKIIDAVRKERRYRDRFVTHDIPPDISEPYNDSVSELEILLEELIARESPQNQFIKYARWVKEMSYKEIADEFKKRFGTQQRIKVQQISYVLTLNRKNLQKKLTKTVLSKRHKQ